MKHERMKILEMLEAGKITAEEATKLLEAMKGHSGQGDGCYSGVFNEDTSANVEDKLNRFTQGVDNFTKEFGARMETAYKDVEPKLKKASQAVLERTAAIFDDIAKSLNESLENARKSEEAPAEAESEADDDDECGCGCGDDEPREN